MLSSVALLLTACALFQAHRGQWPFIQREPLEPAADAANADAANADVPSADAGAEAPESVTNFPPFAAWLGLSPEGLRARWNAWRGDPYPLDDIPRRLPEGSEVRCEREALVTHRGETVPYHVPVTVIPEFRERLIRFEHVVAQVAEQVYERTPRRIRHVGAFACRTSQNRAERVSEHALGNAIDVTGFDFGPLPQDYAGDLPKALRGWFRVTVAQHWAANHNPTARTHARFLRQLIDALRAREDVFRSMIGPPHQNHADHFHFDMAPWRYVNL